MAAVLSFMDTDFTTYACNVSINSLPLSTDYQIVSAQIKQGYQSISTLTITFKVESNFGADPLANPLSVPLSGSKIKLNAKLDFDDKELFDGIVVSHQFKSNATGSRLIVQAKNKAILMAVTTKPEVFATQSDKDIIESLVGQHGLTFVANNVLGLFMLKSNQIVKNQVSDWDFINRRAEQNSTFIYTEGDKVIVEKPIVGIDPLKEITAQYGVNVFELHQKHDDRSLQILNDWNSFNLSNHELENAAEEPAINLSLTPPIQGKNTNSNYRQFDELEVNNWKDSTLQLKDLSKASGTINIKANLDVKPGYTLNLTGFNGAVDGKYIISSVMQEYGQGGFNTYLQYGLNNETFDQKYGIASTQQQPTVYLGIVTGLESDPQNLNRVRIKIPVFMNDTELWARMAQPYASNNFGMVFHPEIGDEVLVNFVGNDLDYPVVIGSMYSPKNVPPLPGSDDNHEKLLQTRFGMKWYWNDEKGIHEISTPAGNKITLSEDTKTVSIEDQNANKIEMSDSAIEFTGTKDINIKANANVKIEGVNIELSGSGIVKIKGSMVQIN